ncbi:ArsR family transcriptional regulator [bacterium]|nr:ArsR family transcriptional regulator [bacterium]
MDFTKLEIEIDMLHKNICQALADPTRILILYRLKEEPLCVNELVEAMQLPQSTISRHLGVLRDKNLVKTQRDGSAIYYELAESRIIEVLDIMRSIMASQLANSVEIAQSLK